MDNTGMPPFVAVIGTSTEPFGEVADAFARSLARQGAGGAALAVYVDGEPVLDLVGGDFAPDTLAQVFSVGKAVVAVAAAHAVAAGRLDIDRPLAEFWPEFDRTTTAALSTRMVLAHRSGIPAVSDPLSLDELLDGALDVAITHQEPFWEPGSTLGYGAFTFGSLMDGVFTRAVGSSVNDYVQEHLAGPLGAEFWFGAPAAELARVAALQFSAPWLTPAEAAAYRAGTAILDGSFAPVRADAPAFFTDPRVIQSGWPGMSGVGTARSIARLLAATVGPVDGVRLLDDAAVAAITETQSSGYDAMLFHGTRFGLGVELPHAQFPMLGPGSFGHEGAGGSAVAVDPARRVSVAYATSAFPATLGASDAALVLLASIRHCLDTALPTTKGSRA